MKRLSGLWEQVVSFENLLLAYRKARKGKANRKEVVWFSLELEKELLRIQHRLEQQIWTPGKYRIFTIYERKPRQISAAPFRDRVVHHALMNVLEPLLDKRFIYDTHACRAGHAQQADTFNLRQSIFDPSSFVKGLKQQGSDLNTALPSTCHTFGA